MTSSGHHRRLPFATAGARTFSLHRRRGRSRPVALTAEPVVIDTRRSAKSTTAMIARADDPAGPPRRWASIRRRSPPGWRGRALGRGATGRAAVSLIPSSAHHTVAGRQYPYGLQQIFQRPREEGYRGGVTILRDYVNAASGLPSGRSISSCALRSRRVRPGRLGCLRNRHGGQYPSPALVLRHGAGL